MAHCEYCGSELEHVPFTEDEYGCMNDDCPLLRRRAKILDGDGSGYPLDKSDYPPMPPKKFSKDGDSL